MKRSMTPLHSGSPRVPRIPRRAVVYLTRKEVGPFLAAIVSPEERWDEIPRNSVPLGAGAARGSYSP
jgi:hypothetical protein